MSKLIRQKKRYNTRIIIFKNMRRQKLALRLGDIPERMMKAIKKHPGIDMRGGFNDKVIYD